MINFLRYVRLIFVDLEFMTFLTNVASLYKNFIHKEGTIIFASFGQFFTFSRKFSTHANWKEKRNVNKFANETHVQNVPNKNSISSEAHLRNEYNCNARNAAHSRFLIY